MRDIHEVIDRVVAAIPERYAEVRDRLKRCSEDAFYTPPELMIEAWWKATQVLADHAMEFDADTLQRTRDIWNGKT